MEVVTAAVGQRPDDLSAMGFHRPSHTDASSDDFDTDHHVVVVDRQVTLSRVKGSFADVVVDGRELLVFTTHGATRDAAEWATKASVPLVGLAPAERVSARNDVARDYLPVVY